jgi:hypothetical protein
MAGAAAVAPLKSDPPIHNLLRTKNGLDDQDHFRVPLSAWINTTTTLTSVAPAEVPNMREIARLEEAVGQAKARGVKSTK